MLFGTASWVRSVEPTGIRQEIEGESYGDGFFSQHWLAFARIARRLGFGRGAGRGSAPAA
jgi:hypothetical protein